MNSPRRASWRGLGAIRGEVDWERETRAPSTVLRIESPGQNFAVTKALLEAGCDVADDEHVAATRLSRSDVQNLDEERGLIRAPRQWYLGFRAVLMELEARWAACVRTHTAAGILAMFDKVSCQRLMSDFGIPIPRPLGSIAGYDELLTRMQESGVDRVFIKLAHGSSASGVVAYEQSGSRMQATTSAEIVSGARGAIRLYNSRRIRRYTRVGEIKALLDTLARERVQVEAWVPKARLGDFTFDLRVLVIGNRARHTVVRMSKGPMTNLHLGNPRGSVDAVCERMDPEAWSSVLESCVRAKSAFPGCHHAGVDVLIGRNFARHKIAEVNAFGDLLPNVTHENQSAYEAQIGDWIGLRNA